MPTISVIVPVYRVEPYLHRCVDSILGQTFQDFELILVDDGSPDNCGAICDAYALQDPRVTVIHQENKGLSAARNAGLDRMFSSGDSQWVTFVDSDDWIHPEMLERLLTANLECGTQISICEHTRVYSDDVPDCPRQSKPMVYGWDAMYEKYWVAVVAWGKLYSRDCFDRVRFPSGKIHEDAFITHQLLFRKQRAAMVWDPYYFYYASPYSITQRPWSPERMDHFEAIESQISFFREHNNRKLLSNSMNKYISVCLEQLIQIRRLNAHGAYAKYTCIIIRKLISMLIRCAREGISLAPLMADCGQWLRSKLTHLKNAYCSKLLRGSY